MTNIVVLDGATLNPGDLSWEGVSASGTLVVHDQTPDEWVVERASGAEILLTNKSVLDRAALEQLPELRFIAVLATGYNVVDIEAAKECGVVVSNVPSYATDSVAQHAISLLLELTNRVGEHDAAVQDGDWPKANGFTFWNSPLTELTGKTLGVVGYGRIGRRVAKLARAFGMRVLANTLSTPLGTVDGQEYVALETLLAESDAVTLHCALTEQNHHMLDAASLALMKPGAFLINTARGGLVHSAALAEALRSGRLGGAGLDVVEEEPIDADHVLLGAPNIVITPHNAWTSRESRQRLMDTTVENITAFLAGHPSNVVEG